MTLATYKEKGLTPVVGEEVWSSHKYIIRYGSPLRFLIQEVEEVGENNWKVVVKVKDTLKKNLGTLSYNFWELDDIRPDMFAR